MKRNTVENLTVQCLIEKSSDMRRKARILKERAKRIKEQEKKTQNLYVQYLKEVQKLNLLMQFADVKQELQDKLEEIEEENRSSYDPTF